MEMLTTKEDANFSSVSNYGSMKLFKSLFDRKQYDYNFNKDKFKITKLKDEDLLDIYNKNFEFSGDYIKRFEKRFDSDGLYTSRTSYWNNMILEKTYSNIVEAFIGENSLVINTVGELSRKPGTVIMLNLDRGYGNY
jgi:hypothetical protein